MGYRCSRPGSASRTSRRNTELRRTVFGAVHVVSRLTGTRARCSRRRLRSNWISGGRKSLRIGGRDEVAWINAATGIGRTITATRVCPLHRDRRPRRRNRWPPGRHGADRHRADTLVQSWWLGDLDTGIADVARPDAPRITVYTGWLYVLPREGAREAMTGRRDGYSRPWRGLVFSAGRCSWLVSTLWDDDWRCVCGYAALFKSPLQHREHEIRAFTVTRTRHRRDTRPSELWPAEDPRALCACSPAAWRSSAQSSSACIRVWLVSLLRGRSGITWGEVRRDLQSGELYVGCGLGRRAQAVVDGRPRLTALLHGARVYCCSPSERQATAPFAYPCSSGTGCDRSSS